MLPDLNGVPVHDHAACMEMLDDDEELFSELVELFTENAGANLDKIEAAAQEGDAESIAICAHTIKGSAANLSVERVRALASELEQKARGEESSTFPEFITALRKEFSTFLEEVVENG